MFIYLLSADRICFTVPVSLYETQKKKKKIRTRETHITNQTHNNNNNNKNREWMHNWRAETLAHSFDM